MRTRQGDTSLTKNISTKTIEFLETSLCTAPALTCWLVNDLLHIWPTSLFPSDSVVQDLYSSAIKSLMDKENSDDHSSKLLCILSKLNLTESKEDKLLAWLYPLLFKICNPDHVELSLFSRKNTKFLKEWHKFLDDKNFRSVSVDNIENAKQISNVIFSTNGNKLNEPQLCAKELTLRVIRRGVHWLSDILVTNI